MQTTQKGIGGLLYPAGLGLPAAAMWAAALALVAGPAHAAGAATAPGGAAPAGGAAAPGSGLEEFNTTITTTQVSFTGTACRAYAFWPQQVSADATFLKDVTACRGDAPAGTDPAGAVRTAVAQLGTALSHDPKLATEPACEKARAQIAPATTAAPAGAPSVKAAQIQLQAAIETLLMPRQHTPQTFETMARDPDRRAACGRVTRTIAAIFDASLGPLAAAVDQQRVQARATDVFRKAESLVTAGNAANALNEIAGSPDKIVVAVMGALGAEKNSDGNQMVLTVNLASLFGSENERLQKLPAWERSLILRAVLPFDATDDNAAAVAGMTTGVGTRLTLQLGGDIVNASDERLPEHNACYLAALGYIPLYGTEEKSPDIAEERAAYVDICHKLAAARQRLAWRAGIGLLTDAAPAAGGAPAKTRVELYAGALVWAPSTLVTTNLIYQHVRIPSVVDSFGAGISVGGNVGGALSGVDAWGRIGLDALGFAQRVREAAGAADWQWQARVGLTIRGRLAGGAFTTVSVGPRFFGDGGGNVDLLSTVSLTYDIDQLFSEVSVPLPLIPVTINGASM